MGNKFNIGKVITNNVIGQVTNKVLKPIEDLMFNTLGHKMLYTMNVSHIIHQLNYAIDRLFPDMADFVDCVTSSDIDKGHHITYDKGSRYLYVDPMNASGIVKYKGTPIVLNMSSSLHDYGNHSGSPVINVTMTTIRTVENIRNLRELVERMIVYNQKKCHESWCELNIIHGLGSGCCFETISRKFRTFDDVYITDEEQNLLTSSLDKFVSRRDWYFKNNIPYHFGIILYGQPGSGKSSLAQAIANYVGAKLFVLNGDDILRLPNYLSENGIMRNTVSKDLYQVILVEDIDCGFEKDISTRYGRNYQSDDDNKRVNGLASLLNSIDGLTAPSNTIFIFTTNHIEKLDPALIRPGRIDLKLEIGYVNNETFNKFCKSHYGKTVPTDLKIKDGLTFAELQLHIMKDATFEELVDIVKAD